MKTLNKFISLSKLSENTDTRSQQHKTAVPNKCGVAPR